MRHIFPISVIRPARADDLSTISAFINLLTSIVGLLGQVLSLFGLGSKATG